MRTLIAQTILSLMSVKALAVAGMLSFGMAMTACHTVEGAGRDVQSIGEGVEDTADDVRPYE